LGFLNFIAQDGATRFCAWGYHMRSGATVRAWAIPIVAVYDNADTKKIFQKTVDK